MRGLLVPRQESARSASGAGGAGVTGPAAAPAREQENSSWRQRIAAGAAVEALCKLFAELLQTYLGHDLKVSPSRRLGSRLASQRCRQLGQAPARCGRAGALGRQRREASPCGAQDDDLRHPENAKRVIALQSNNIAQSFSMF